MKEKKVLGDRWCSTRIDSRTAPLEHHVPLRIELPERYKPIGFADDFALVVVAMESKEVENKANESMKCIS